MLGFLEASRSEARISGKEKFWIDWSSWGEQSAPKRSGLLIGAERNNKRFAIVLWEAESGWKITGQGRVTGRGWDGRSSYAEGRGFVYLTRKYNPGTNSLVEVFTDQFLPSEIISNHGTTWLRWLKNSAVSMATPVSGLPILAIQTAMCLRWCFNNCKMINEAVKDSYWNCSIFIAPGNDKYDFFMYLKCG